MNFPRWGNAPRANRRVAVKLCNQSERDIPKSFFFARWFLLHVIFRSMPKTRYYISLGTSDVMQIPAWISKRIDFSVHMLNYRKTISGTLILRFLHSHHMGRYCFYVKITFGNFIKSTFLNPRFGKNAFYESVSAGRNFV